MVPCSSQGMPKLIFPLEKGLKKSIVDMYKFADVTQLARVTAFQAVGCAFESRHPLFFILKNYNSSLKSHNSSILKTILSWDVWNISDKYSIVIK